MRTFVALPVAIPVRDAILALVREWRAVLPSPAIRWVNEEQIHLTLQFLGETNPDRLEALTTALRSACQDFPPLSLAASEAGFFPNERRPRVLWVGLDGDLDLLQRLQCSVAKALSEFTEKQEGRAFHPHLTLARLRDIEPRDAQRLVARVREASNLGLGAWRAEEVELMRSELRPEGSRYTCLARLALGDHATAV
jgi:RNA 2',3'-cyclic 3'-phosphodiesterase